MSKSLAFTLPLIVYPFDIRFSFNEKTKAIKKYFKKNGSQNLDFSSAYYEMKMCKAVYMIWDSGEVLIRMKMIPDTAQHFSFLQHEITHCVMFILDKHIGMPHNPDSTEAYAYLTDYITREVYSNLPKFK